MTRNFGVTIFLGDSEPGKSPKFEEISRSEVGQNFGIKNPIFNSVGHVSFFHYSPVIGWESRLLFCMFDSDWLRRVLGQGSWTKVPQEDQMFLQAFYWKAMFIVWKHPWFGRKLYLQRGFGWKPDVILRSAWSVRSVPSWEPEVILRHMGRPKSSEKRARRYLVDVWRIQGLLWWEPSRWV